MYKCPTCLHVGASPSCNVPMDRRSQQIPWNSSHRQLWAAVYRVLGIEPQSSGRTGNALHHWAISLAQEYILINVPPPSPPAPLRPIPPLSFHVSWTLRNPRSPSVLPICVWAYESGDSSSASCQEFLRETLPSPYWSSHWLGFVQVLWMATVSPYV